MKPNGKATLQAIENSAERKQIVMSALDKYERPLTRYAQRMFGSTSRDSLEEARDAVQHTFLKLCQQNPEAYLSKIGPWLYTVCRNRVIDQLRQDGKISGEWPPPLEKMVDDQIGPQELAEQGEYLERLSKIIGCLGGVERDVIELWSQGFNHREISEVLDKSEPSVRVGLHRALKKLKSHPEVCRWLERATSHPRRAPISPIHGQSTSGLSASAMSTSDVSDLNLAISKKQTVFTRGEQR